jgi:DNA-binding IclR family transcriptional regulator
MVRTRKLLGISMIGAFGWTAWRIRRTRALHHLLLTRVRGEYREMPGLSLTLAQACRLWQLDPRTTRRLLDALIRGGVVYRTGAGRFVAVPK